jgi:chromosome segregation ATPase
MGALLERIDELLRTVGSAGDSWRNATARIENTLTEGYAHALALEGERWRLHRRIGEAAAGLSRDDADGAHEISLLARRLAEADDELTSLRERLDALRRHASELRLLPARSR